MMAESRLAGVPGERLLAARGQHDRMRVDAIAGMYAGLAPHDALALYAVIA
jgi:hypothetical protein